MNPLSWRLLGQSHMHAFVARVGHHTENHTNNKSGFDRGEILQAWV
jgi:hypothetical protein